jgi:hypothetical protein
MSNPYQSPQSPLSPPPASSGQGLAIAGFVLGLFGLVAWCLPLFGLPINIVGLILSAKGRRSSQRGLALAGIVLCSIGLGLALVNAALGAYLAASGRLFQPQ